MADTIEIRSQSIWLDSQGIIRAKLKPHVDIGLADAEEAIAVIATLCSGTRRPALIDMRELKSMDRNARTFFAGPSCANEESAAALLIGSPVTKAIGNFFLGLNKPLMPTRLFTDEAAALAWLEAFLP